MILAECWHSVSLGETNLLKSNIKFQVLQAYDEDEEFQEVQVLRFR